jgi:hypothetical protein
MRALTVDYTGQQGGLMAMAFAAGWAVASALWIGIGGIIWKMFVEPRIRTLESDIESYKRRIDQLETVLLLHGPQQLRQAMQAAISETHIDIEEVKAGQ